MANAHRLSVRVGGVMHWVAEAVLIDGRVLPSWVISDQAPPIRSPRDCDGNTARITLLCEPDLALMVNPATFMEEYAETVPEVDCMTCLIRRIRS